MLRRSVSLRMWRAYSRWYPKGSSRVRNSSMVRSKWTLFSHNVSSASIRIVSRGIFQGRQLRWLGFLGHASGKLLQNFKRDFLRIAVVDQIILKFAVHLQRVASVELCAQD